MVFLDSEKARLPASSTSSNTSAKARLLRDYKVTPGVYDEMLDPSGAVREPYRRLLAELDQLGPEELQRRWDTGRRFIHEQGVTYNVYGDPLGMERPWELDSIPIMISAAEWGRLESALIQRAQLLNAVIADCYGEQKLIQSGRLPPALVLAQPDFLRPCHGIRPVNDVYLNCYAVDLARSPDGKWWAISDRTQIPTGSGYTLANRLVTSRVLPEVFRDCNVRRLAGFYSQLRNSLSRLAQRRTDDARIVMLTPGPHNETYFEQSYLARYLGFTLVEGQDLAVRDGKVFLKTLSGLEPVDVILRRVDDDYCDPLELRNHSMLGVPGLVEALRTGTVAVANSLGSGLLQSPAFMAFLPGLCEFLLGEELKLPSVATWWCGQKSAESHVLANLESIFVKPAMRSGAQGMTPGAQMTAAEREALKGRIRFQPHLYVAQERVELSTAPTWSAEGRLTPRPVAMRVYLVAAEDGSYYVMPGGLSRIAPLDGARMISMQRGGSSKDIWVMNEGPADNVTLLPRTADAIELRRTGNNLPSRVADNLYWLGRYAERVECTARLLRSSMNRLNSETASSAVVLLEPFLQTLEAQDQLPVGRTATLLKSNSEALEAELLAIMLDDQRSGSLYSIAEQLQRLGMQVRDRTSNDFWRAVSVLGDTIQQAAKSQEFLISDAIVLLNQVLLQIAAVNGLAYENMTRAQGWRFLDIGRRVERTIYFSSFLGRALKSWISDTSSALEAVLEMADSTITYRSRYNLVPTMAAVYDLVMLDETNPRSLLFQFRQLTKHLERLPGETVASPSQAQKVLIEAVAKLRLTDPMSLESEGNDVASTLEHLEKAMPKISDALAVSYFAHSSISRAGPTNQPTGGGGGGA
jgi:uncharacterized circularly permuted ATP-grasp superfamily protein/uncharacterized alpha-E superfamily protein